MLWLIFECTENRQKYLFYHLLLKQLRSWGKASPWRDCAWVVVAGFVYFHLVLWVGADALVSDMIKHQSLCPMGIDVRRLYYTHETSCHSGGAWFHSETSNTEVKPVLPLKCLIYNVFPWKRKRKKIYLNHWHNLIAITNVKGTFLKSNGYQHVLNIFLSIKNWWKVLKWLKWHQSSCL